MYGAAGCAPEPEAVGDASEPEAAGDASETEADDAPARTSVDDVAAQTITAPANTWAWVDVPGAVCGNGAGTGFGINVGTGDDILIYLEGGGLCWDEISCRFGVENIHLASYVISGYTQANFDGWKANPSGIFDKSRADNPFKNSTIVYVPYCTGDFHAGTTTQAWHAVTPNYTMHYAGRQNLDLYLAQIVPSFPNASRVTLSGTSAGGFGATINYGRVRQAFGDKRVDLVADSGPMLPNLFILNVGSSAWNLPAALPPDCADCQPWYSNIYTHYATKHPDSRFAFLSYDADVAMALGNFMLPAALSAAFGELTWNRLRLLPNARYFLPDGTAHGMLYELDTAAGPYALGDWLGQMKGDDPAWSSRTPTGTQCPNGTGKVNGESEVKYIELGSCAGSLGLPTSVTATNFDNTGRRTMFQNGAIWWHPNTGAHLVRGSILSFWASKNYERSAYGYPKTDPTPTSAGDGEKNLFSGGGVYSWSAGTFGVMGAIWTTYHSLGAEAGALGLPLTDETPTGLFHADRVQEFQHGFIYWNPLSGTKYWMK